MIAHHWVMIDGLMIDGEMVTFDWVKSKFVWRGGKFGKGIVPPCKST